MDGLIVICLCVACFMLANIGTQLILRWWRG